MINSSNHGYDLTKLIIKVNGLGLSGFEVYALLKDKYKIQIELAETYVILAVGHAYAAIKNGVKVDEFGFGIPAYSL